ncbi:MAG: hypothetical protein GXY94_01520 [Bacteroidales bacterium]|nr:hypothetical protein [Bacteroidales bacterium]
MNKQFDYSIKNTFIIQSIMKKIIFSLFLILFFDSCSEYPLNEEIKGTEKQQTPILEDWKDGGSENIEMYSV